MIAVSLTYFAIVAHAHLKNFQNNLVMRDSTEDLFASVDLDNAAVPFNADISNDDPVRSSTASPYDISNGDLSDGDLFSSTSNAPISPPSVNDEEGYPIDNSALAPKSYDLEEDPFISTAGCNSGGDTSTESWGSSASTSTSLDDLDEGSILIANSDDSVPDLGNFDPRYWLSVEYELDPRTGPDTLLDNAYAADGTPLKPKICADKTRKSCCTDETFTLCWIYPLSMDVCRYAKKIYCCDEVAGRGAPGIGCKPVKWVRIRGKSRKDEQDLPPNQPNPLEGVFDLFKFPEPNPQPKSGYCPVPSRR